MGGGFGACVEELPLGEVCLSRCGMALCLAQWVLGTVKDLKFLPYLQAYSRRHKTSGPEPERDRDSGHQKQHEQQYMLMASLGLQVTQR